MTSKYMIDAYPNESDRKNRILKNQLYGIATTEISLMIINRLLYGNMNTNGNIAYIPNYKKYIINKKDRFIEGIFNKEKDNMKFDVVVANPPYDRTDIQMRFAKVAFDLCDSYSLIIMPAKWQCKGDKTREMLYSTFRKEVVPHMSYIKYFIDSTEIFDISESAGISYYIADKKEIYNEKIITNQCKYNKTYNNTIKREFKGIEHSLNNNGQKIIDKIKATNKFMQFKPYNQLKYLKYQFWCNALVSIPCKLTDNGDFINCIMSPKTGKLQVLGQGEIITNKIEHHDNYNLLFSSNSLEEVKYFMSYTYTKFVRFLIFNSIAGLRSVGQDIWWRFVPNQDFNHEFTDDELYKKYGLTDDEIEIIEGTITDKPLQEVYSWQKF